jgi:hypothetical protein
MHKIMIVSERALTLLPPPSSSSSFFSSQLWL